MLFKENINEMFFGFYYIIEKYFLEIMIKSWKKLQNYKIQI